MGLVDKKSELSGFRKEFNTTPLKKKPHEHIKKFNPTPLVERKRPDINSPQQGEKLRSNTDIKKFDNSSKLTSRAEIKRRELSSHLEFSDTPIVRVSQRERFKGQTTPNKFSNESQFLGETSVNEFNKNSQFLGETDVNDFNNSSQFLGETTPNQFDNSSQFLGETTQPLNDNSSQYLGETTQNPFDNSSQFLGEVTNPQFDNSSQLISITTNGEFDSSTQYNDPTHVNIGRLNQVPIGAFLSTNGTQSPTLIGEVNNIQDIHATGFTSNLQPGNSQFRGIEQNETIYISTSTYARNFQGERYSSVFSGIGQGWERFGIAKGHLRKTQGKTFLEFQYEKNDPKRDSPQLFGTLFDQPYIVRGIENPKRRGPEYWGIGGITFDDGLIRGGAITSTVRAAVDVVRIGKFYASVRGAMSLLRNFGMQLMNPVVEKLSPSPFPGKTRIFTPINQIANIATQHLGIRWKRHGILPVNEGEEYGQVQSTKRVNELLSGEPGKGNRLVKMRKEAFAFKKTGGVTVPDLLVGLPFPSTVKVGGPDSFLGIGITKTTRRFDSREGPKKEKLDEYLSRVSPALGLVASAVSSILPLNYTSILGVLTSLQYFNPEGEYTYSEPFSGRRDSENSPKDREDLDNSDKSIRNVFDTANQKGDVNRRYIDGFAKDGLDSNSGEVEHNRHSINRQYSSNPNSDTFSDDFDQVKERGDANSEKVVDSQPNSLIKKEITPDPLNTDFSKIAALAYGRLDWIQEDGDSIKDYRIYSQKSEVAEQARQSNYTNNNRETMYGIKSAAPNGADRSDYKKSLFVDPIQGFEYKGGKDSRTTDFPEGVKSVYDQAGSKDFIRFVIGGETELGESGQAEVILFRAYIESISDSFTGTWSDVNIMGRNDPAKIQTGWSRGFNLNFTVVAHSRDEMKPIWRKLNYLAGFTAPSYIGNKPYGSFLRLTLGNLFYETPMILTTLNYEYDLKGGWEIEFDSTEGKTLQLPKVVKVSMTLDVVQDYRPQRRGRFFSLSERGSRTGHGAKYNWLSDSTSETGINR